MELPAEVTNVTVSGDGDEPRSGTVTVHEVCDGHDVGAAMPPKYAVTTPLLLKNPVPERTTDCPAGPAAGLMDEICTPPAAGAPVVAVEPEAAGA